jgi:hypothetical protein
LGWLAVRPIGAFLGALEGRANQGTFDPQVPVLGLLIPDPRIRVPDLADPELSHGFSPNHPPMTSFLGAPTA